MPETRRTLYLIDGSGYIFRAFFALPQMNTSHGLPTNAVYGFVRMLFKLLKESRPSHVAVVFDSPRKTFRDDLFESYKANRRETPSDLSQQIPYIYRAVDTFGLKRLMSEGYEADDVIGTLAVSAARDGFNTVVVTSDKDFMQLVSPHITLWDTMRDKRVGMRDVRERFGVEPRALIDIMALMGDSIDNIKGVPGVGEKTASALIQHYGSLDALLAHPEQVEQAGIRGGKKIAGLIEHHRGDVELARKLVRIDTEVQLEAKAEDFAWSGVDQKSTAEVLRELEFNSLLAELTPTETALPPPSPISETRLTSDTLGDALTALRKAGRIALDLTDTDSCAPKSAADMAAAKVELRIKGRSDDRIFVLDRELIPGLRELFADGQIGITCHDLKRHLEALNSYDITLDDAAFDTLLAGFLVNPGKPEPSLTDLYHQHLAPLGGSSPAAASVEVIERLREALLPQLERDGLEELFNTIEIPVARVLAEMERTGIGIDASALAQISAEFGAELERLERECYELAGQPFNLNSPLQLRKVLFDDLKLSAKGLKKTKSGFSTDADTLEKLAAVHPLPRRLIEYRGLAKLKSTYSDALAALIDPATSRIHTSFHQALTATGRLSSANPNLQNIPTRSEAGRRIRRAFVAAPGTALLSADYSQIELRVLAHLSRDPTLIEAFAQGEDIHLRTAREVIGSEGKLDNEARRLAKVINFGIIYGMGPQRLAGELSIPLSEASSYIKRYFERLPGVRKYLDETLANAREFGFVTTMYGRRRYLPELRGPDGGARAQAERIAINTPIQGSAADLIKLAMVRLHAAIGEQKLGAKLLLQVHDELLLEVAKDAFDATRSAVKLAMEGVAELAVPLVVELKSGPNWAEMTALT
jgi:DNA polymerase-1